MFFIYLLLKILPVHFFDSESREIEVLDGVEVDRHSVTTLTKWLYTTGGAEAMVDRFLVELVGSESLITFSDGYLTLRYKC